MAKVKVTKKEADRLMKLSGTTRGIVLKTLGKYILNKKGKSGLEMVEERLKELGYSLKFEEVFSFGWYLAGLATLAFLVTFEIFNWDEKKALEIGYNNLINSRIAKLMLGHFVSAKEITQITSKVWHTYSNIGEVKWIKYDIKEKNSSLHHSVLRLSGFEKLHPIVYLYVNGFLKRLAEIVTQSKNLKVELTKCILNGDPYDEFKFTWK
jgi:hypothetical protein